ncbi:MAG: DUF995 domain-containing protein [Variovorax sp.]|nr:DUF995 domain-containing protein [Variovorax sp.]
MNARRLIGFAAAAIALPLHAQNAPAPDAAPPAARSFLGKDEVLQTYVGRAQTIQWSSGVQTQWDVREGGNLFYNNRALGNVGGNGSGTWEIKDNGAFCWKWNRVESGNPGCLFYARENGKTLLAVNQRPDGRIAGEVLSLK